MFLFFSSIFAGDAEEYASPPLSRYQKGAARYQSTAVEPDPSSPDPIIANVARQTGEILSRNQEEINDDLKGLQEQLRNAILQKEAIDLEKSEQRRIFEEQLKDSQQKREQDLEKLKSALEQKEQELARLSTEQDLKILTLQQSIEAEKEEIRKMNASLERHKEVNLGLKKKIQAIQDSKSAILTHGSLEAVSLQVFLGEVKNFIESSACVLKAYEDNNVECGGLQSLLKRLKEDSDFFKISGEMRDKFVAGDEVVIELFSQKKEAIKLQAQEIMKQFED